MEEKFSIKTVSHEGTHYVYLSGTIDEDSRFDGVVNLNAPIVFNFKNVGMINSLGIRNWVNFIKSMATKAVYYAECPPVIVRQLNMVPSFKGHAVVMSAYVPYVCDDCGNESTVLVNQEGFSGDLDEVIKCNKCGSEEMELDGHPKQYFAFAA